MASTIWSRGESLFSAKLAEIDPDCDFIRSVPAVALDHFNLAFALLYHGRRNVRKCKHAKLAQPMTRAMDDDVTSGYDDMEDACQHVFERTNAKMVWEESWPTTYVSFKGFDIAIPGAGAWQMPAASRDWPDPIWNFCKAIEDHARQQVDAVGSRFAPNVSKIVDGFDKSAFNGMTALLAKWPKDMDEIDKMAWMADPDEEQVFSFRTAK